MTRFSAPFIIRCPKCAGHLRKSQLLSFNDFGSITWSDGYTSIWALNAVSALGICPWCKQTFWADDAEEVGRQPRPPQKIGPIARAFHRLTGDRDGVIAREEAWLDAPSEWKTAKSIERPKLADWHAALRDHATLNPERARLARRHIWWYSNDHLRVNRDGKPSGRDPAMSRNDARENLEELLHLWEIERAPYLLEVGEILRELGRFDEAIATLEQLQGEARKTAMKIAGYARRGDPIVFEVSRSEFDF